jgi:hypothetical protein
MVNCHDSEDENYQEPDDTHIGLFDKSPVLGEGASEEAE